MTPRPHAPDTTWQDVATINGYGMLGTATGGLVGVIALYDEDDWSPMATSTLVGTTVGLGVGSVLSARNDHASDVASTSLPDIDLGRSRWQPNVSARPWMDDDGNPGAWVELSLTEVASNRG